MEILHRDDHFIAVNKPAGLASVRERWTDDESALVSLWQSLRAEGPDATKPRVVHRLDKGTSGVLLFAASLEAARGISRQFKEREVEKTYLALVLGTPPDTEGEVELILTDNPHRPGCVKVAAKRGKPALTSWIREEAFRGYALLRAHPHTGRTHQIRVSFRHLGHPLIVDTEYGGRDALYLSELKPGYKKKRDHPERPILGRLSLHALETKFRHPITGDRVTVSAPLPKDMSLALKYLRKYRELKA